MEMESLAHHPRILAHEAGVVFIGNSSSWIARSITAAL